MKSMLRPGLSTVITFALFLPPLVAQDSTRVTIEGTLVNDITGAPIEGAEISLSDSDVQLVSDSEGHFRLIDIKLGSYWLSITAAGFRAAEGEFLVDKAGAFTIGMEPLDGPLGEQFGQVRGIVHDRASGRALESAQVSLSLPSRTTFTDNNGRFLFRNVPPGSMVMRTELLGYGTRADSVSVPPGHLVSVELELSVVPVELEPISVVVERQMLSLDLAGFYDRRENGLGFFLTREEIVEKRPVYTADVFNGLPGVRVVGSVGLDKAVILRAGARPSLSSASSLCGPTVYLDGMLYEKGGPESVSAYVDRIVRPDEIAGIEIYTSAATVPLQYQGMGSDCGVIVIWTR